MHPSTDDATPHEPGYVALWRSGALARRATEAVAALEDCRLCPRLCGVNRLRGELGFCGVGRLARVDAAHPHFGEESPLVGEHGSGTIFMSGCNLSCVFCQNADISQNPAAGRETTVEALAAQMLAMQGQGCHNINIVTPSHVVAQVLEALAVAAGEGLRIPLVYNSGGYDAVETLALLEGVVDIYLPDCKFWSTEASSRFCAAPDYPERAREAIAAMHAQVGDLVTDAAGTAVRGLLVRHLALPEGLAGTQEWMAYLASLSPRTYVNVMDQYRPCHQAGSTPGLSRSLTDEEYGAALGFARAQGLRLDERSPAQAMALWRRLLGG